MTFLNAKDFPNVPAEVLAKVEAHRRLAYDVVNKHYFHLVARMQRRVANGFSTPAEEADAFTSERKTECICESNPFGIVDPDTGEQITSEEY